MDYDISIEEIERRLRSHGTSVDDFCREVEIDRSTWQRWKKNKTTPRLDVWKRVVAKVPPKATGGEPHQNGAAA